LWASGYAAYEKLSPDFRKIIDGKQAVYTSANTYVLREPLSPNAFSWNAAMKQRVHATWNEPTLWSEFILSQAGKPSGSIAQ